MRKRKYPTSDDFVIAAIKKQLELAGTTFRLVLNARKLVHERNKLP
jgi:hypothetical protein